MCGGGRGGGGGGGRGGAGSDQIDLKKERDLERKFAFLGENLLLKYFFGKPSPLAHRMLKCFVICDSNLGYMPKHYLWPLATNSFDPLVSISFSGVEWEWERRGGRQFL